jgi:hypothetical protein
MSPDPEREALIRFLDLQRTALTATLEGLSEVDARRTPTVSALSLLSMVRHSAIWERRWFQVIAAGRRFPGEWPDHDPDDDSTFRLDDADTIESAIADYRAQSAASNDIVATLDLATPCTLPDVADLDLRWVALHMIEETARHAGHADIIREAIDGRRGR